MATQKKTWFKIVAPKELFNEYELGETLAYSIEQTVGRSVELPIEFAMENPPNKGLYWVKFKIVGYETNTCKTEVKEFFLSRKYELSLPKVGTKKIDGVIDVVTKDGKNIRVKWIVIANGKPARRQRKAIRKLVNEFIENTVKEMRFYELLDKIFKREFQTKIEEVGKKIYPIKIAEIRKIEVK